MTMYETSSEENPFSSSEVEFTNELVGRLLLTMEHVMETSLLILWGLAILMRSETETLPGEPYSSKRDE